MNLRRILLFSLSLSLVGVAGCRPPKIDASSDAALDASVKKITANMSEGRKTAFASDCLLLTMPKVIGKALKRASGGAKPDPPSRSEIFKPLDGKTAEEIQGMAAESRATAKAKDAG